MARQSNWHFSPVARHAGSNQAILARLQAMDSLAAFLERAQMFKRFEEVHGLCLGQEMPRSGMIQDSQHGLFGTILRTTVGKASARLRCSSNCPGP